MTKADVYFAVIPEWVIYSVSPRALQVYAILRRHADYEAAETFISRRRLAELGQCSVDTIDRALDELVRLSAIDVEPRHKGGRQTSNLYSLWTVPRGGRIDAEGGVGIDAEGYINSQLIESYSIELAHPSEKAMHDEMVWALVDAMGWDRDEVPATMWGRVHKAAKELTEIGADPAEVPGRVLVYRAKYRSAALTPTAIASNWPALSHLDVTVSDRDMERESKRARTRTAVAQLKGTK